MSRKELDDPRALTYFYMDTMLCNDYMLENDECMGRFSQMSYFKVFKRRKLHRECLNYLDQYKACVIGIN